MLSFDSLLEDEEEDDEDEDVVVDPSVMVTCVTGVRRFPVGSHASPVQYSTSAHPLHEFFRRGLLRERVDGSSCC